MIHWHSSRVQEICLFLFEQSLVLMLGIYGWEVVLSFKDVELALIMGELRFRWTFIPYFFARYGFLADLFFVVIYLRVTPASKYSCTVLGPLFSVFGSMMVAAASTNLLIRTATLWRTTPVVFYFLIVACLGQWGMTFVAGFSQDHLSYHVSSGCTYDPVALLKFYYYTIGLDFIILVLTIVGLRRTGVLDSKLPLQPLWKLVFGQGIAYFVLTTLANIPILILGSLQLNSAMSLIAVVPASTIAVICSTRSVTTLLNRTYQCPKRIGEEFSSYRLRDDRLPDDRSCDGSNAQPLTTNISLSHMGSGFIADPEAHAGQ